MLVVVGWSGLCMYSNLLYIDGYLRGLTLSIRALYLFYSRSCIQNVEIVMLTLQQLWISTESDDKYLCLLKLYIISCQGYSNCDVQYFGTMCPVHNQAIYSGLWLTLSNRLVRGSPWHETSSPSSLVPRPSQRRTKQLPNEVVHDFQGNTQRA